MRLIIRVFQALQTFDRPATRRELERECSLSKDEVHLGLKGLARRKLIVKDTLPRQGGVYRLVPGATLPEDLRGKYVRDPEVIERMRRAYVGYHAYQAARASGVNGLVAAKHAPLPGHFHASAPSTPSNAPGSARLVVKGMLEVASGYVTPPSRPMMTCLLDEFWKRKR